ncbi:MAG: hypothetical protein QF681_16035 [Vicinamibacterales bacterium]|jgi:hypothetical protein|nr:hypothetical protein [Vicinamibacterales bacterium]
MVADQHYPKRELFSHIRENPIEADISSHTGSQFSHGLCPECSQLHDKQLG